MNTAHAELRKLLTLPSLRLTALLTWTANLLLTLAYASAESRGDPLGDDLAVAPLGYTQAGFLVFGALAAASEHQAGGQIRTTLLAMPRRLPLQATKALTLAVVTLPLAAATAATSTLPAGEAARTPAASAYLTLTALLAAAVTGLVRRAEPALVLLLTLYFIVGPLLSTRYDAIAAYLPDTAALDPSRGAAATISWTLSALTLAALTFHRRDA
jgi:ABC-2 type transport system permease protein